MLARSSRNQDYFLQLQGGQDVSWDQIDGGAETPYPAVVPLPPPVLAKGALAGHFQVPVPGRGLLVIGWGDAGPPPWIMGVARGVASLLQLPANWSSYGSERIAPRCAVVAIRLLQELLVDGHALPAIVPRSDGGIQLEWHRGAECVEVHILPSLTAEVYAEADDSQQEWLLTTDADFVRLRDLLSEAGRESGV